MQKRTIIAGLLVVALAASVGGAIQQTYRLKNSRMALTTSQRQTEQQVRELTLAKARESEATRLARAAEGECDALQKRIEAMANQATSTNSGASASRPLTGQEYMERQLNLTANDPEYQKLSLAYARAGYGATYARFYRERGLTPEQIARFEDLLIARLQANYDLVAAAQTQGIKINDPAYRKLRNPASEELVPKLKALLGEEGYAAFRKAGSSTLGHYATSNLTAALFYSDAPLAPAQADQLIEIVNRNVSGSRSAQQVDWNAVYPQLENVLTPPQLATLKTQRETERLNREMRDLVDKATAAKR